MYSLKSALIFSSWSALACSVLLGCGATATGTSPDASPPGNQDGGADAASPTIDASQAPDGMPATYAHTVLIDGSNDFDVAETFTTSSSGYTSYVAWDADYLYLAIQGADIASADATRFVLIYLGTASGSMAGVPYNTQEPALPFSANYHLRWKADNTFTNAMNWDGNAWVDAGWDFSDDVVQQGDFLEFRIPRSDIGSPARVSLYIGMINETNGVESSFAALPADSLSDGYDPDYTKYYDFDLQGTASPTSHNSLP